MILLAMTYDEATSFLKYKLKECGVRLNKDACNISYVLAYLDAMNTVGYYTVEQWVADTKQDHPDYLQEV